MGANFLLGGRVSFNLSHLRDVTSLCMLYKIVGNRAHSMLVFPGNVRARKSYKSFCVAA